MTELHWVITKELQDETTSYLFQKSKSQTMPERGFLGVIYAGNGCIRRSLFLRKIIPQQANWVRWTNEGLMFEAVYFSKALNEISDSRPGAGLIMVHSHPLFGGSIDKPPIASDPDLLHEKRLLYYLARALPIGAPVASGIVDGSGAWRVREYWWYRPKTLDDIKKARYRMDKSFFKDACALRIVSSDRVVVHKYRNYQIEINATAVDSTLLLWGKKGHLILSNLRIGVAGLGGVGSIITEYLARLGVGELVLVDYDIAKEENRNRLIGLKRSEVGIPKIKFAARIARQASTATAFKVRTFRGSVAEREGLKYLLDSDVILNAADSAFARQVLDHVSYAYLIPVIDGGTILKVKKDGTVYGKSQITKAGLGNACLECSGSYTQEDATLSREDPSMQGPEAYIQAAEQGGKKPPRGPSVISHNGLVAALMVQRLLTTVLGFPPYGKRGEQRYYVQAGNLQWMLATECKPDCPKREWIGLGDSHPVPVGIDLAWKQMREEESSIA